MFATCSIVHFLKELGVPAVIKYPNDIIFNNKKISGVLIESIKVDGDSYCIVGVGLNINNSRFPSDLPDCTSIYQVTEKLFEVDKVFKLLIEKLKKSITLYLENKMSLKKAYFSALHGTQQYVPCLLNNRKVFVKILATTKRGFLSIQTKNSVVTTVNANDIKFLLY